MVSWSDNPATSSTVIRAGHISELRKWVNIYRVAAFLPIYTFTDATVSSSTPIRAVHFTELRTAIQDIYTAKGSGTIPNWSAGTPPSSSRSIHASDINDLRSWVDIVDPPCYSTFDQRQNNLQQTFTGGVIADDINDADLDFGISPAALATITSMETESLTGPDYNSDSYGCSPCNRAGAGATQIGRVLFDEWNRCVGGNSYTFCEDICGEPGSDGLRRNLGICAMFLYSTFSFSLERGYTNQIEIMALAATVWNGLARGSTAPNHPYYPFCDPPTGSPFYLPDTSVSKPFTDYGSTAGYIYSTSGLVGDGVLDTSQLLPT